MVETERENIALKKMRERLIELINQIRGSEIALADYEADILIDHLIENNVVVLPCKAGDTIYRIRSGTKEIIEEDVLSVHFHKTFATIFCFVKDEGIYSSVDFDDSGKNIFYTREEAEKALERSEEK